MLVYLTIENYPNVFYKLKELKHGKIVKNYVENFNILKPTHFSSIFYVGFCLFCFVFFNATANGWFLIFYCFTGWKKGKKRENFSQPKAATMWNVALI